MKLDSRMRYLASFGVLSEYWEHLRSVLESLCLIYKIYIRKLDQF